MYTLNRRHALKEGHYAALQLGGECITEEISTDRVLQCSAREVMYMYECAGVFVKRYRVRPKRKQ